MAQSAKGSIPMELNPVPLLLCNGLETRDVSCTWCKHKMMSFKVLATWAITSVREHLTEGERSVRLLG